MRFSAGCLVGVIFGLLIAAAGVGGYLFFNTRQDLPLFPAGQQTDSADVTVVVGEEYLNQQMQGLLATRGMSAAASSFRLHAPNQAVASADFAFLILGQNFTIRPDVYMHFNLAGQAIAVDIDRIDISGFSVPQEFLDRQMSNFRQLAQDQLNSDLKTWLAGSGLHIVSIQATEGELVLKFARQ